MARRCIGWRDCFAVSAKPSRPKCSHVVSRHIARRRGRNMRVVRPSVKNLRREAGAYRSSRRIPRARNRDRSQLEQIPLKFLGSCNETKLHWRSDLLSFCFFFINFSSDICARVNERAHTACWHKRFSGERAHVFQFARASWAANSDKQRQTNREARHRASSFKLHH